MKKALILTCVGLACGCTMNQQADPRMEQNGEASLAAALTGYEQSGPPVACVQMRDLRGNRSAGDAIIFEGATRHTLYVNRPAGGCPDLSFSRALVTHTTQTQLCRGDIATVFDPVSRISYGGCGLGDFTPYRRVGR